MEPLAKGDRLPDVSLPSAPDGAPVPLRAAGRTAPIVVVLRDAASDASRAYAARLAAEHDGVREWDGRVLVVAGRSDEADALLSAAGPLPFPVLADPDRRLIDRLPDGRSTILIADQWGELHLVELYDDDALPPPAELEEWARYLAVQCPECQGEAL
jgi:peroxiredoxin